MGGIYFECFNRTCGPYLFLLRKIFKCFTRLKTEDKPIIVSVHDGRNIIVHRWQFAALFECEGRTIIRPVIDLRESLFTYNVISATSSSQVNPFDDIFPAILSRDSCTGCGSRRHRRFGRIRTVPRIVANVCCPTNPLRRKALKSSRVVETPTWARSSCAVFFDGFSRRIRG